MPFRFNIVSDVREVLRGNEAMERGFEDTADSLDELARAAQMSGGKVSREFRDAGDDVEQVARGLERKFRDATDDVARSSKKAGDELGDNIKRGTRDAGNGLGEFRDEADSTAREAAASFDGSADSIVDAFQETAANAFAGFGPLAAAGGLAAAAGIGTLWTQIQEDAQKSEDRIQSMYDDMLESQDEFLSKSAIQERVSAIVNSTDDAAIGLSELEGLATLTGVSVQQMLLAWAGDQRAANDVLDASQGKLDELSQKFQEGKVSSDEFTGTRYQITDLQSRLGAVSDEFGTAKDRVDLTTQAVNLYTQNLNAVPDEISTDVAADPAKAYATLDALGRDISSRESRLGINGIADPNQFQQAADEAARQVRPPTIQFRVQAGSQRPV